jgi:hypothetical protein
MCHSCSSWFHNNTLIIFRPLINPHTYSFCIPIGYSPEVRIFGRHAETFAPCRYYYVETTITRVPGEDYRFAPGIVLRLH